MAGDDERGTGSGAGGTGQGSGSGGGSGSGAGGTGRGTGTGTGGTVPGAQAGAGGTAATSSGKDGKVPVWEDGVPFKDYEMAVTVWTRGTLIAEQRRAYVLGGEFTGEKKRLADRWLVNNQAIAEGVNGVTQLLQHLKAELVGTETFQTFEEIVKFREISRKKNEGVEAYTRRFHEVLDNLDSLGVKIKTDHEEMTAMMLIHSVNISAVDQRLSLIHI